MRSGSDGISAAGTGSAETRLPLCARSREGGRPGSRVASVRVSSAAWSGPHVEGDAGASHRVRLYVYVHAYVHVFNLRSLPFVKETEGTQGTLVLVDGNFVATCTTSCMKERTSNTENSVCWDFFCQIFFKSQFHTGASRVSIPGQVNMCCLTSWTQRPLTRTKTQRNTHSVRNHPECMKHPVYDPTPLSAATQLDEWLDQQLDQQLDHVKPTITVS